MRTSQQDPVLTLWHDEPALGVINMAADELLAEEVASQGGIAVRLYGWSRPTLSLGGFQKVASAEPVAQAAGLDLVRRPSGGGAILHGTDLTYAAAVARGHTLAGSPQQFYDALHATLVEELRRSGVAASMVPPSQASVGGSGESAPDGPLLCFDRRAVGDVVLDGHKLMGSAQRRLAGSILQHGSLLVRQCDQAGPDHTRPGLLELTGSSEGDLVERWMRRLSASLGLRLQHAGPFLCGMRLERVAERAERFSSPGWIGRR
jgi:lipoate-protein ligase A